MTAGELAQLGAIEERVRRSWGRFLEDFADGLLEIRDGRLYRETHSSFDAYCREVWGHTGRYVDLVIAAAEVRTVVPIENEAQGRALAPMRDDPKRLREVWHEVQAAGRPTARRLSAAVKERQDAELKQALTTEGALDAALADLEAMSEQPKISRHEQRTWADARQRILLLAQLMKAPAAGDFHPALQDGLVSRVQNTLRSIARQLEEITSLGGR